MSGFLGRLRKVEMKYTFGARKIGKCLKIYDECQIQQIEAIKNKYTNDYWNRNIMKEVWADPWLIALAICEEAVIVTEEKTVPNRIPSIANHFGISCLNRFDFFKAIGVKY
jgi:hypothetical protein